MNIDLDKEIKPIKNTTMFGAFTSATSIMTTATFAGMMLSQYLYNTFGNQEMAPAGLVGVAAAACWLTMGEGYGNIKTIGRVLGFGLGFAGFIAVFNGLG